jgi:hypothetical protein
MGCEVRSLTDQALGFYRKRLTHFVRKLEGGGARGTRTLTAFQPGDFKSYQYTNCLHRLFYALLTSYKPGDIELLYYGFVL